jgi:hypothetical protein
LSRGKLFTFGAPILINLSPFTDCKRYSLSFINLRLGEHRKHIVTCLRGRCLLGRCLALGTLLLPFRCREKCLPVRYPVNALVGTCLPSRCLSMRHNRKHNTMQTLMIMWDHVHLSLK